MIDPNNPYPNAFTGHIRAVLNDGRVSEERQPHFRGGANEPLTRADIEEKFVLNARHGGWSDAGTKEAFALLAKLYDGKIDLRRCRGNSRPAILIDSVHFVENAQAMYDAACLGPVIPLNAAEIADFCQDFDRDRHIAKLWKYYVGRGQVAGLLPQAWPL